MSSDDPEQETLVELISKKDLELLWAMVAPGEALPAAPRIFVERLQLRMLDVVTLEARAAQWLRLSGERHQQLLEATREISRLQAHCGGLESQVGAMVTLCKEHKLM